MGFAHDRRAAQSYSLGETMRSIHRLLTVVLVLAGTLTSTGAYGQGGATGAISGAVVDTSGGSVAEAEVQVLDTRTESLVRKVSTTADGSFVFFFQAEDGIRDYKVTGVQTCALPIFATQRILVDLAMRQNASVMHAVREQLSDPHRSPTAILSEIAENGMTNFLEGQKDRKSVV